MRISDLVHLPDLWIAGRRSFGHEFFTKIMRNLLTKLGPALSSAPIEGRCAPFPIGVRKYAVAGLFR
jgi:hypothetical protein